MSADDPVIPAHSIADHPDRLMVSCRQGLHFAVALGTDVETVGRFVNEHHDCMGLSIGAPT